MLTTLEIVLVAAIAGALTASSAFVIAVWGFVTYMDWLNRPRKKKQDG